MKKITPIKPSDGEYEIIQKINELVEAVNEMIPFTVGLEEDNN